MQELLRRIPSVGRVLQEPVLQPVIEAFTHGWVSHEVAGMLEEWRERIKSGISPVAVEELEASRLAKAVRLRMENRGFCRVVNGTGVILHTNLGRSPLATDALAAVMESAGGYSNLELDLSTGKRGHRFDHIEDLLCYLTGAEAAMVVNNNAAAVLLALSAVAKGKEVIISRGQLVEIGGSFRIPEVMAQSGATLVEVGATNKTHLRDYEKAITDQTGLLLKVHTSNYRIVGFTAEVPLEELVGLGRQHGLPVMEDLGSGSLIDGTPWGLPEEPTVQEAVRAGADLVTFSGDKLLGGPQGGIVVGKKEWVDRLKRHPLARALRVDKLTLAGLEATLRLYLNPRKAMEQIPIWRMLTASPEDLAQRAAAFCERYGPSLADHFHCSVQEGISQVGGGSLPQAQLPTWALALIPRGRSVAAVEEALRSLRPVPVMVRVQQDTLLVDFRTLLPGEEGILHHSLLRAVEGGDR